MNGYIGEEPEAPEIYRCCTHNLRDEAIPCRTIQPFLRFDGASAGMASSLRWQS